MDPVKIEYNLEKFTAWIEDQPDLPQNLDKLLLIRYLKASDFSLERAKFLLRNSLKWRKSYPHIFTQRDPLSDEIQKVVEYAQLIPLLDRTPENYKVTIFRLVDENPDIVNFNHVIKAFYIVTDIRLVTLDELWGDGEIPVFDMSNITLRHFTKIVFSTMRLFLKYSQEAHPVTVRQVHIVNCNSLVNRILQLIKPFLKTEVAERIHTHLPGAETLFKFIPRNILPKEYGGTQGPINTVRGFWLEFLTTYRDYVMKDENWQLKL